jgi:PAS domain S-box-containing protein
MERSRNKAVGRRRAAAARRGAPVRPAGGTHGALVSAGGLLDNAHDLVYRMQLVPTRRIEYVSAAARVLTGHPPEDFYEDPDLPAKHVHPDDVHLLYCRAKDPSKVPPNVTIRWIHPDGRIVWAEHRRVLIRNRSGAMMAVEGIARDVSAHVDTQQKLRESEKQLRELAARVQSAREEERAGLARELHDDLGQTLTAVKLELGRAATALAGERITTYSVDRVQSLVGLIDIALQTVKRLCTELRPPTLDHLGLPSAIQWEARAFQARTGIRCHVRARDEATALTRGQQTMLFRIFQEALTNVVRHARASAVEVTLAERSGTFALRIRDNGVGISERQARDPRSIGLLGMRERAAFIGGSFDIAGRRGKGTAVSVKVPLTA